MAHAAAIPSSHLRARGTVRRLLLRLCPPASLILALLLCLAPTDAFASHFRYGHLSWKARPDLGTHVVEFSLFNSFRRDGYAGSGLDGYPIIGDVITEFIGATTLDFGDGIALGTLDYVVIAYDPAANWIYVKALADANNVGLPIIHTYSSAGPWTAQINSCCRIGDSVNSSNGSYRVLTTVNLNADTSAPVSTLPAIVNCLAGSTCNFWVPAADADGDVLSYRLASLSEDGGMSQPTALTVNQTTGQVNWSTTSLSQGLYSVQVVVEARIGLNGSVKSQVAVDFLMRLSTAPPGHPPTFDQTADFACGRTFDWVAGRGLSFSVAAQDGDVGSSVTLNGLGLPNGATMTPGLPLSGNPVSSTFRWRPSGNQGGAHVIVFTATDNTGQQTQCPVIVDVKVDGDGDGLPDDWEINGYTLNGTFVNLPAMGADPNHKDIFIEVDYMTGLRPRQAALNLVRDSFASVPNGLFAIPNPDGHDGVSLHIVVDDEVPRFTQLGATSGSGYDWAEFDEVKHAHFAEALALSHHYALFIHTGPTTDGGPNSGISRGVPSSDFLVSLGSRPSGIVLGVSYGEGGTLSDQAGTFMHELGHNLGLRHGGFEDTNRKPNYLSVMNYAFQFSGLRFYGSNGRFDYSRFNLPMLNESNLDENVGLHAGGAISGYGTSWFCGGVQQWVDDADGAINWNCNKRFIFFNDIEINVATDVNRDAAETTLASFIDWANLNFRGGLIGAGSIVPLPTTTPNDEVDLQTAMSILPSPPSGLSAALEACAVHLTWTGVGPVNDYSYRVYRKNSDTSLFGVAATVDAPAWLDNANDRAQTYLYYVGTLNALGAESATSQVVTVRGTSDLIDALIATIEGMNVARGTQSSLVAKLKAAKAAFSRGSIQAACNVMNAFNNEVDAQAGKRLSPSQTTQLKREAAAVAARGCCSN